MESGREEKTMIATRAEVAESLGVTEQEIADPRDKLLVLARVLTERSGQPHHVYDNFGRGLAVYSETMGETMGIRRVRLSDDW